MRVIAFLAAIAALTGCPPPRPTPLPGATCADMCRHLTELRCPGAGQTPEGATCVEVCASILETGLVTFDLACRSSAASCSAIDRCEDR